MAKRGRPRSANPKITGKAKLILEETSLNETFARLARLKPKALTNANKAMLRACATKLSNQTKILIRNGLKNATRIPPKWGEVVSGLQPLTKAPHVKIGSHGGYAIVSIYNNATFLVHMHNKGADNRRIDGFSSRLDTKTKRRYRKKGAYRGSIKAQRFIERAVEICNPDIKRIQEQAFVRNVTRQWQKYGN